MTSQAPSSTSIADSIVGFVAALLTKMSILPNSCSALDTRFLISSIRPRWAGIARPLRPMLLISSATFSRSDSFLLATTTSAPALARPTAEAFPMPRLPPVTSATFPDSDKDVILPPFGIMYQVVRQESEPHFRSGFHPKKIPEQTIQF